MVDTSGEEVQAVSYTKLGLKSPVDLCEWRGLLAVADCSTSPEAVILVNLASGEAEGRIDLPRGLAEAGPRFLKGSDGGLQLILGMSQSHRVTDATNGLTLLAIKESLRTEIDVAGLGMVTVDSAPADQSVGPTVRISNASGLDTARTMAAGGVSAQSVEVIGTSPEGDLLVQTSYFLPGADGVEVKFYVEQLSRDSLCTKGSVSIPTEEFHLWPLKYLEVDQEGQTWCMVAAKDHLSFRVLTPTAEQPDVKDGSVARSMHDAAVRLSSAISRSLGPDKAFADSDPPARANPWTRDDGNNQAWSYWNCWFTCSSGAYYRSCGGSDNIVPRNLYSGGTFQGVSYAWGKWTTPSSFKSYVEAGTKDAGDIGSQSVETCTVGVDCSGLVSRIWGLSTKHNTSGLTAHANQLSDSTPLSSLVRGDVFDRPGTHVLSFQWRQDSNTFYAYESTTRNNVDRVMYWARSRSELMAAGYHMYRYKYWTD